MYWISDILETVFVHVYSYTYPQIFENKILLWICYYFNIFPYGFPHNLQFSDMGINYLGD